MAGRPRDDRLTCGRCKRRYSPRKADRCPRCTSAVVATRPPRKPRRTDADREARIAALAARAEAGVSLYDGPRKRRCG